MCHMGCRAYERPEKCRTLDRCHPMEPLRDGYYYCPRHDPNLRPPKHPAGQK